MYDAKKQLENEAYQLVLGAVLGLPQMEGKTLVHLSVTGSRSKQLASPDSDYDVKAVILHSTSDYLLQRVTRSKAFKTDIILEGKPVELEGTLVDYLTMTNYALASNQTAYDALFGITVHETSQSQYLKQLFCKAYNPKVLMTSYTGLMKAELKKAEKQQK